MPYAFNNDSRLYYEVHGSGTPLVLISGMGGDLGFWTDSISRLQHHFQVIVFDNRGIGRSDTPDTPYSMELFADDLAAILEAVQVESAHILGFSLGGCVAQAFALKYPDKLRKLIIAASYAKIGVQAELYLDAVLSVYESGATAEQMYRLVLPWLFSPHYPGTPENSAFLEFDHDDPYPQPLHGFKQQYLGLKGFDARSRLNQIQAPTLVMAGQRDALIPIESAQELIQGIPNCQHFFFPNEGHLFNVEQPDVFHEKLLAYLNS